MVDPKNAIRLAVELSAPEMPTRVNMCNKSARAQKPTSLTLKTNGNFSQHDMTQGSGLCIYYFGDVIGIQICVFGTLGRGFSVHTWNLCP